MRVKKIFYFLISLLLAIACFFVVNFMIINNDTPEKPENRLSITISDVKSQSFGLLYIAQQKGYFEDENLAVTFRTFNLTNDALQDAASSNSDLAAVYEIPYLRKVSEGYDIHIISSLHRSKNSAAIVGLRKNGITQEEDLKGKKIAVVKSTNSEFLLFTTLKTFNIPLNDVTIIYTESDKINDLLKTGEVDAVSTSNTNLYLIQETMPTDQVVIFYPESYIANSMLVGNRSVIESKKEEIQRLINALVRAEVLYRSDPNTAVTLIDQALPNSDEKTIRSLWNNFELTLSLDNVLLEILNSQSQALKQMDGFKASTIDFRKLIYVDYLKKAKPADVTLF